MLSDNGYAYRDRGLLFCKPLTRALSVTTVAFAIFVQATASSADPFETVAEDFLIQNVCVDGQGRPVIARNPLDTKQLCPVSRDLTLGEALPYHKHDWANNTIQAKISTGLQRTDSFPYEIQGSRFVVAQYDFGFSPRAFGRFDQGEGGQLIYVGARSATVIVTQDSKGLKFMYGPGCQSMQSLNSLTDSWLLFDNTITSSAQGIALARLSQSLDPEQCPMRLGSSLTLWSVRD